MRAKTYLRQIELLDKRINNRLKEIDELRADASRPKAVQYDGDPIKGSGTSDHIGDLAVKMISMEEEINYMTNRLMDLKHKIVGQIEQLNDPRHVELLMLRYVQLESFDQIASAMSYDVRWIYSIHGSALQEFERVHFNSC